MSEPLRERASTVKDIEQMKAALVRLRAAACTPLDAALAYTAMSIPIFPCSPANKRPLVRESAPGKGDGGLYRATADEAKIRAWWTRWPSAMIGMPTGAASGFVVIDCDPAPGQPVGELVEDLRKAIGGKLPPCPMSNTPRGGMHLFFSADPAMKVGNRANLLGSPKGKGKIDVRGDGGYIILPPSVPSGSAGQRVA